MLDSKKKIIITVSSLVILAGLLWGFVWLQKGQNSLGLAEQTTAFTQSFDKGNLDQAILDAQALANKNQTAGLLLLAASYAQKGSLEFKEVEYGMKAINTANQVLTLDSSSSEAYRIIGYANEIMNKFDDALQAYKKSISLDPKNSLAYSNIGHAYNLLGDKTNAEANYLKALEIDKNSVHALYNLSRLYFVNGYYEKAKEYAEKVLSSSTNIRFIAESYDLLGLIAANNNNFDLALKNFNLSISQDPSLALSYVHAANAKIEIVNAMFMSGKLEAFRQNKDQALLEAKTLCDKAISLNPNLTSAYIAKSQILTLDKKYTEALTTIKKAQEVVKTDITLSVSEKEAVAKEIALRSSVISSNIK
jgi:tetratricopeptide (TPR) repeat protein